MHKFQVITNDYVFLLLFADMSNAFVEVVDFDNSIFNLCYDTEEIMSYWHHHLTDQLIVNSDMEGR